MAQQSNKIQGISEKSRGTQDELEVLKMIINGHPGLKTRILTKLREIKNGSSNTNTSTKLQKESKD